ncbi:hypothetical protein FB45DRAFT_1030449 [Roridomyces roridus]|uniref:Uncharacterized protein n=1 Tax=Roridomyces roridus TaxID=1738132 RepID=A0AAD7FIJ1_9AGAR|nr:hypothetical protein FB45DRAFT_1030449 [Roridomyces roridus]
MSIRQYSAIRPGIIWELLLAFDSLVEWPLTVRLPANVLLGDKLIWDLGKGSIYFGIIVISNLANVLSVYLGDVFLGGFMSWFTTNLSLALICRLMLNLHEAGAAGMTSEAPEATLELQSIRFAVPRSEDADVEC